jgi:hypothetical protein
MRTLTRTQIVIALSAIAGLAPLEALATTYAQRIPLGIDVVTSNSGGSTVPTTPGTTGTLGAPVATLSAQALDFGGQPSGTTNTAVIVLTNTGTAELALSAPPTISGDPAFTGQSLCPATLAVGASCPTPVTFNAEGLGSRHGLLIFSTNAGGPFEVSLDGASLQAEGGLSTGSLSFGDVYLGVQVVKTVALSNVGNDTLPVSAAPALTGSSAYAAEANCSGPLAAGESCYTNVTFTPAAAGPATGDLTFSYPTAGVAPVVALTGNGVSMAGLLGLAAPLFDPVTKGSTAHASLTLTNLSDSTVPLAVGTPTAPFSATSTTCGSLLATNATCVVDLAFTPTNGTGYNAGYSLPIQWGFAAELVTIPLTGTVYDSSTSVPSLVFADTVVSFSSASQDVVLTNTGSAPLTFDTPTVTGPYTQSNDCSAPLPVGQHCTASVMFKPTSAGSSGNSGTLSLGSSTIALSGNGVAASYSLSATWLKTDGVTPSTNDFGTLTVGSYPVSKNLTLTNMGDVPATLGDTTSSAAFLTSNSTQFKIAQAASNPCSTTIGATLAVNASCNVIVSFAPLVGNGAESGAAINVVTSPSSSLTSVPLAGISLESDPNWVYVTALLHFDTSFVDVKKGHNFSVAGGAPQITAVNSKFGGGSLSLGVNNYLGTPYAADLNMRTYDFAWEAWVYKTATNDVTYGDGIWAPKTGPQSFAVSIRPSGAVGLGVNSTGTTWDVYNSIDSDEGTARIPLNTWTHIAVSRSRTTWRVFVNGVIDQSFTTSGYLAMTDASAGYFIGRWHDGVTRYFNGNIDDVRITRGNSRYTTTFAPPVRAFPNQ